MFFANGPWTTRVKHVEFCDLQCFSTKKGVFKKKPKNYNMHAYISVTLGLMLYKIHPYAIGRIQSNRSNFDIRGYLENTTHQKKTSWIDQKF